ncbi:hypothetical protein [Amycolatopsis taiwanensis]|uniref:hypothetical protein n=1 Tax=Amycolatopsis taiwanensis TaxID=342230 RepID=UPI000486B1D6|nr:hypothetical protein [Amycolatopsis taiwanensis]
MKIHESEWARISLWVILAVVTCASAFVTWLAATDKAVPAAAIGAASLTVICWLSVIGLRIIMVVRREHDQLRKDFEKSQLSRYVAAVKTTEDLPPDFRDR